MSTRSVRKYPHQIHSGCSDGTPLREDVKTRDELYAILAAKINELPREQRKAEAEAPRPEAAGKADAGKKGKK
jgi:hypothetical protein